MKFHQINQIYLHTLHIHIQIKVKPTKLSLPLNISCFFQLPKVLGIRKNFYVRSIRVLIMAPLLIKLPFFVKLVVAGKKLKTECEFNTLSKIIRRPTSQK